MIFSIYPTTLMFYHSAQNPCILFFIFKNGT